MKRVSYFFFALLVLSTLVWSCKKDDPSELQQEDKFSEIITDFNQILDSRSIPCIDIPELCPGPPYVVGPAPQGPVPGPGGPITSRVVFKDGNLEYMVYALPSEDGAKSFMVETEEQQMVISDTQDELFTRFSDTEIELPDCLYSVFNMDYQKWQEGTLSVNDVSDSYEGRPVYNNSEEGYLVVADDFLSVTDSDCPPPSKSITKYWYCSYRNSATTNAIIKNLMVDLPPSVVASTKFTIQQAVADCAKEEPNCFTCIDQSCIHEKLKTSLGDNLTKKMRLRHLQLMLGFSDDEFEGLVNNHGQEIIDQLLEAYNLKRVTSTCDEVCGSHCAIAAQTRLFCAEIDVTDEMAETICETCTSTYKKPEHECYSSITDPNFLKDWASNSDVFKNKVCCFSAIDNFVRDNGINLSYAKKMELFNALPSNDCPPSELEIATTYFDNLPEVIAANTSFLNDSEEVVEINNGITLSDFELWDNPNLLVPVSSVFVGSNVKRDADGDPDLSFGKNGDLSLIKEPSKSIMVGKSDALYYAHMEVLLDVFGAGAIGNQYLNTFISNTAVQTYYSEDLSKKVFDHPSLINFIKEFGAEFSKEITEHDGVLFDMDLVQLNESQRPKFNRLIDHANGLKILINDTEYTKVFVEGLSLDFNTRKWNATFYVNTIDNFGLDPDDIVDFQSVNLGFTGWWLLQHRRNYKPFITDIKVKLDVEGSF